MRWVHLVFAALFAVSAALQVNDPDPLRWIVVWSAAAAVAAISFWRPASRIAVAALAAVCGAWMAMLAPGMLDFLRLGDWRLLAATMQAGQPAIESAREFLGLLIILVYAVANLLVRNHQRFDNIRVPHGGRPNG